MTIDISVAGGRTEMAYAGEVPWHRLGTRVPPNARVTEAMRAAHLDWTVSKRSLAVPISGGSSVPVNPTRAAAIVRDDLWNSGHPDLALLEVAGGDYEPLQNTDAFAFVDPLIESGYGRFERAGTLGRGERAWVLLRLEHTIRVAGSDQVDCYLLVSNTHDGRTGVEVKLTTVRLVCRNGLTMARSVGSCLHIPHDKDARGKLGIARAMLRHVNNRCQQLGSFFQALAQQQVSGDELAFFLDQTFPDPTEWDDAAGFEAAALNRRLALMLFEDGTGNRMKGVEGSLWAAINGVTELLDHRMDEPEHRMAYLLWGDGYYTKLRALSAAATLVGHSPAGTDLRGRARQVPSEPRSSMPAVRLAAR